MITKRCRECNRPETEVVLVFRDSGYTCPECLNKSLPERAEPMICAYCEEVIRNPNTAVFNRDSKKPYHDYCSQNMKDRPPRIGRAQIGSFTFRRGSVQRGLESQAAACAALSEAPSPGEWGPQRA